MRLGDVVTLNSGGIPMTVVHIDFVDGVPGVVRCAFAVEGGHAFFGEGGSDKINEYKFDADCLTIVKTARELKEEARAAEMVARAAANEEAKKKATAA